MDPLCGSCYGNSENISKLYGKYGSEMDFDIIPIGIWTDGNIRKHSPQLLDLFLRQDLEVAKRTGIKYSNAYTRLLESAIDLNSEIPSRAIMTMKCISPSETIPFAIALQKARYYFGKDLNLYETYLELLADFSVDTECFMRLFESLKMRSKTQRAFKKARKFMKSVPTMLVEIENRYYVIEQGYASLSVLENRIEILKQQRI